jgi:DNA repair exonuclease SbcCD ATPase subunit
MPRIKTKKYSHKTRVQFHASLSDHRHATSSTYRSQLSRSNQKLQLNEAAQLISSLQNQIHELNNTIHKQQNKIINDHHTSCIRYDELMLKYIMCQNHTQHVINNYNNDILCMKAQKYIDENQQLKYQINMDVTIINKLLEQINTYKQQHIIDTQTIDDLQARVDSYVHTLEQNEEEYKQIQHTLNTLTSTLSTTKKSLHNFKMKYKYLQSKHQQQINQYNDKCKQLESQISILTYKHNTYKINHNTDTNTTNNILTLKARTGTSRATIYRVRNDYISTYKKVQV